LEQNEQVQRVRLAGNSPSTANALRPQWHFPVRLIASSRHA
jgi:hypothetical protein